MSKFLVFDSRSTQGVDTLDDKYNFYGPNTSSTLATAITALTAVHTYPVRCYGADGEVDVVGWEFLLDSLPAGNEVLALCWWQEFYGDIPSHTTPPERRRWADVNRKAVWPRETLALSGGLGVVSMYPVTREMDLQILRSGIQNEQEHAALYVPLSVHTLWARLGLYVSIADCTGLTAANLGNTADNLRLRIFAHAGGHDEDLYMHNTGDKPYVYNAYKS